MMRSLSLVLVVLLAGCKEPEQPAFELSLPHGNAGLVASAPAVSPDGNSIIYAADDAGGRRVLWLHRLSDGRATPIAGTVGAQHPFWSPDGKSIGYTGHARLRTLDLAGTTPRVIAAASGGGTWSAEGVILFTAAERGPIQRVSANGGAPSPVVTAEELGLAAVRWPFFLPDGDHFLFLGVPGERTPNRQQGIYLGSLDRREKPRFVTAAESQGSWVDEHLLFVRDGVVFAQKFDAERGVSGQPIAITPVQTQGTDRIAHFSAGSSLFVFQPRATSQLTRLALRNRQGQLLRVVSEPASLWAPRLSPDGRRVAVDRSDRATSMGDIWTYEVASGKATRVTSDPRNETMPVWSPRGDAIAFLRTDAGGGSTWLQPLGGRAKVLISGAGNLLPNDWSPDGEHIAYLRVGARGDADVLVHAMSSGRSIEIAASESGEDFAVFSPDGKWIAYTDDALDHPEVWVQPFPPTGEKIRITNGGGAAPRWPRQDELYYMAPGSVLTVISPTGRGTPTALFHVAEPQYDQTNYDVAPDGTILVNEVLPEPVQTMRVVWNWKTRFGVR